MSSIKCPFCNGELVGTMGHPICRNQNCVMCDDPMPQDLLEELIRTRKALEIAVKRLGYIKNNYKSWTPDRDAQMIAQAANGLDEIKTALEQKD